MYTEDSLFSGHPLDQIKCPFSGGWDQNIDSPHRLLYTACHVLNSHHTFALQCFSIAGGN